MPSVPIPFPRRSSHESHDHYRFRRPLGLRAPRHTQADPGTQPGASEGARGEALKPVDDKIRRSGTWAALPSVAATAQLGVIGILKQMTLTMKNKNISRVVLAPISYTRKEEFLNLARKSRSFHRTWVQAPVTEEKFREFIKRTRKKDSKSFFILELGSQRLVGVINLSNIIRGFFQSAYLGYYVFKPFAKKGYMTEALRAVLMESFCNLGLHRIEANIQPSNKPSRRLVQNMGFRLEGFSPRYLQVEGTWRDHERWAITIEDWNKVSKGINKKIRD